MTTSEISGAVFSADEVYRYELWRRWAAGPELGFGMLNPSTAGAFENDPTIRKCIGFAKRLGFGGLRVANMFGARATDPKALRTFTDPVGPENDAAIVRVFQGAQTCIVAWGASDVGGGLIAARIHTVLDLLARHEIQPHCLGRSKDGHPRHPLMLAYSTPLEVFASPGDRP